MKLVVAQPQDDAPAGHVTGWAQARGVELDVVAPTANAELPDPSGYDALIALGSEASLAHDTPAWVERQLRWMGRADDANVPMLGICFGAQALAVTLGGHVDVLPVPEVGWVVLDTDDDQVVAPGPWMSWHEDAITLAPPAREIARSAAGTQAFVCGRHLGVQFHPEATPEIVAGWVAGHPGGSLADPVVARDALEAVMRADAQAAQAGAWALLDGFVARM